MICSNFHSQRIRFSFSLHSVNHRNEPPREAARLLLTCVSANLICLCVSVFLQSIHTSGTVGERKENHEPSEQMLNPEAKPFRPPAALANRAPGTEPLYSSDSRVGTDQWGNPQGGRGGGGGRPGAPGVPVEAPIDASGVQNRTAKLFVGQLPFEVDEQRLYELFGAYGTVSQIHILRDQGDKSRGAAFITYSCVEEADTAIFTLHRRYRMLTNRSIQVSYAKNSANISRYGTLAAYEVHFQNQSNPIPDLTS